MTVVSSSIRKRTKEEKQENAKEKQESADLWLGDKPSAQGDNAPFPEAMDHYIDQFFPFMVVFWTFERSPTFSTYAARVVFGVCSPLIAVVLAADFWV